jgi:hypothetical protein
MTLPVVFRSQAAEELLAACDFLEAQREGLSPRLIGEVRKVIDRISVHPELHGFVLNDIRRAAVRRFPYSVFYRVTQGGSMSSRSFTTRVIRQNGKVGHQSRPNKHRRTVLGNRKRL